MKSFCITLISFLFIASLTAQPTIVNTFQEVEITLNKKKQVMPLSLPAGTTSYFYAITVLPKKNKRPAQESLYSQVLRLNDNQPLEQIAQRVSLPSKDNSAVNVILVKGKADADDMRKGKAPNYEEYFLNQPSGATYMTTGSMEDVYIGIENRWIPRKYRVLVEVIAVVE
jgi:hypothetical protein